ncbi:hypothetical protein J4714_14730 [Staphylococcus epidermidis]|nr:hypothetical protein [Staphylococcus epidermidis]
MAPRHGAAPVRAGAGGDEGPGHAAEICRLAGACGQQRGTDRSHAQDLSRAMGAGGAAFGI